MTPNQRWFSASEISDLLGVSRGVIERYRCELGAVEISPRLYRYPLEGLELFLRTRRVRRPNARPTVNADSLIARARREVHTR